MTAFLADGDPPSDRTTMVLTPHTEGHTSGWIADLPRVDKTLVLIETLHGTQPAVEVSVAAVFSAPINDCSNNQMHHEHQWPLQSSSDHVLTSDNDRDSYSDFLNNWDEFYAEFIQSPTYVQVHSTNNQSSSFADDDDNKLMSKSDVTTMPNSQHQLRLTLWELAKVNWHIFNILEECSYPLSPHPFFSVNNPFPDPNVPPPFPSVNNPQQPKPCLEPQHDCAPQCVILQAPPPAPDPDAIPRSDWQPRLIATLVSPAHIAILIGTPNLKQHQFQTGPNQQSHLLLHWW